MLIRVVDPTQHHEEPRYEQPQHQGVEAQQQAIREVAPRPEGFPGGGGPTDMSLLPNFDRHEEHKLTPSSHEKKIRTDKLTIPRPEADWLWDRVNGFGLASLLQTKH
uniref:Uncharacterized protein n=1 Tax=Medicago truncatula TaxID=3880 RepID=A2Q1U8_MEDTR|nr:hypothetical protein MtrDRAFT_AC149129g34v2 [Medicago truncatula]